MQIHELKPAAGAHRKRRRIGRGIGSGRGTYSTRGLKGQKSRAGGGVNPRFEGGQLPLVLRLPHKRGFTNFTRVEYQVVNVSQLGGFAANSVVDPEALLAGGLVRRKNQPVKLLASGEIDRALTIRVHKASAGAREKIEAAGGTVELIGGEAAAEAAEA